MADDGLKVVQLCGECRNEIDNFTIKKENMMLSPSLEMVWGPACDKSVHEIREVEGRPESIQSEQDSYPRSVESRLLKLPEKW